MEIFLNKKKLNELIEESKTFCILPWIHLHVMPDSSVIPCCVSPYDDHYGDGKEQVVAEIWNSEKYKQLRLNMLNNIASKGCARCYKLENSGFISMRNSFNLLFKDHVEKVNKTNPDGSLGTIDLKYIDIRFSNLCNFKCRGCSPALSSSWYDDHQALLGFESTEPKVRSVSVSSPNFWNELKSMTPYAEEIYFGGGEPLITKEHYEILRYLDSLGRFNIRLGYNTNLSTLSYGTVDLAEMWAKFDNVRIGISIDDLGPRAEYFRHGTKWEVIERNIIKLRDNYSNLSLYVNCTVNIMNVYYLPDLYDHLTENKIIGPEAFNLNLLLDPAELTVQVLPKNMKVKVANRLRAHINKLSAKGNLYLKAIVDINNLISFMDEKDKSGLMPIFQKNTLKLDKLRNEDFLKTYPELSELLTLVPGN